jgi:hypothetical protein
VIRYRRARGLAKLTRLCIAGGDSVGEADRVVAGVLGGVSSRLKFSLFSTT